MKYFNFCIVLFLLAVHTTFAQVDSDTFKVRVFGGLDIIPPSTPTLLLADPVAATQIDISWTVSVDNYAVAGYSILRDGLPVATTSLTSYSDGGLTASTTYVYQVRAFDAAINYSTTSNSLLAVTPDYPVPPTSPVGEDTTTQGTYARVQLSDFYITPGISTTSLHLETPRPARIELRWGRTSSYELGYVMSENFVAQRDILLTDLEPGTVYEYEIIGYTPFGVQTVLKRGKFTTLDKEVKSPPPNVSRFWASVSENSVELQWRLPPGDVSYVRVVRSHLGFPQYPQDGAIVYQGLNTSVKDVDILSQYSPVYYTAFVYDSAGNVSSGAVAIVYAENFSTNEEGVSMGVTNPNQIGKSIPDATATSSIVQDRITADMKMPLGNDILFRQLDQEYTMVDFDITLSSTEPFSIVIPANTIAGNLKSIIVTLLDPTDNRQQYSFLLRLNKDQTAYEATVAPVLVEGSSRIVLQIFDYEALVVATYQNTVDFSVDRSATEVVVFPDVLFRWSALLLPLTVGLLLLFSWFIISRFRTEDKNRV